MLRAAELTLQEGHHYFETVEKESTYIDSVVGGDEWLTTRHTPNASLLIRCLDEKREGDGIIYDAVQLCDNIRSEHRITPKTASQSPQRSTAKVEAIVKAAIKESRLPKRPLRIRTLLNGQFVKNPTKDYAKKARDIAITYDLSDLEKLHSLATLSADHATAATDQQEKDAYTRLHENFMKEAQTLESSLALAEETTDREESEVRQVADFDEVGD